MLILSHNTVSLNNSKIKKKMTIYSLRLKKNMFHLFSHTKKSANKYQIKQQIIYKNRYISKQEKSILKKNSIKI